MTNLGEKKPYSEEVLIDDLLYRRVISSNVNELELKWHWDEEDRLIILEQPSDWLIQIDNQLPIIFPDEIYIPEGQLHRVIKGSDDLKIYVYKISDKHRKELNYNENVDV